MGQGERGSRERERTKGRGTFMASRWVSIGVRDKGLRGLMEHTAYSSKWTLRIRDLGYLR